jgi:hypothetical protein
MPLNESRGWTRSNLTKEQKRQAVAAIYGHQEISPSMNQQQFSDAEIERMRQIIGQHDSTNGKIREFDLNNPPKLPYSHQEFPKVVYHHGERRHKKVHSAQEHKAHLADGWKNDAYPADESNEPELDPATAAEVAAVDEYLAKLRAAELAKIAKKAKKSDE